MEWPHAATKQSLAFATQSTKINTVKILWELNFPLCADLIYIQIYL